MSTGNGKGNNATCRRHEALNEASIRERFKINLFSLNLERSKLGAYAKQVIRLAGAKHLFHKFIVKRF